MFFVPIIIISVVSVTLYPQGYSADYYTITRLTDAIYKRFYLIKRLEQGVHLLHEEESSALLDKLDQEWFHNYLIKEAVLQAKSHRSLNPLRHIWSIFSSYQHIHDPVFTDEYVKLICFFYMRFFMHNRLCSYSLEEQLQYIDIAVDNHNGIEVTTCTREASAGVTTDDIVKRYFVLKRISEPMHIIDKLSKHDVYLLHNIHLMSYKNKKILQLWEDMHHYKYIGNEEHMRYFLWYIFIMLYKHKNNTDLLPLVFNQQTNLDFDRMDIEELLSAIDSIVNNFNHINQHYQSSGLSFTSWITHYWWVPTLVIASIVINILKHYYVEAHNTLLFRMN